MLHRFQTTADTDLDRNVARIIEKGFTTGAAASAAVQAALIRLLTGNTPDHVTISFLGGGTRTVPVQQVICKADNRCEAIIVKDAGDDPDITHNARIGAV